MKNIFISAFLLSSAAFSPLALADNHTVSLGYAQSKLQALNTQLKGVNLKYRYEWDSPLSVIGSMSYLNGNSSHYGDSGSGSDDIDIHAKTKVYSLSAGPAWRFNDYLSVYGLVGINHTKADENYVWKRNYVAFLRESYKGNDTSFMYGAGVQINPVDNIAIDIGYEGTRTKFPGGNFAINGFNIGVGYRF
ncbi:Ail/Lom family outer membrane beta-barrel protein [Erwinia psidii]|uniref:Ail/Lom family protein n=1 Tax=Erwinia psidii TaxID=69224 RepID=A0A3N6S3M7_9GAMM|nr:Ail/Lom family outer membrane beta-barrel protein [Erwinia psidii]MCX8957720.1 Ail/Lom family protein [Erwinia psidii]MCX8960775.1 Ail/Lom family protein [Erwinia psidii]MCX8963979.1 Ail/Lom family protein [Erwinia psidii]RQM39467.1 Ail/Lom family protein [Erwinia psidii]